MNVKSKRRYQKISFIFFIVSVVLLGCSSKEEGKNSKVTVAEFMDYYEITEEELDGIDLQANIDYYNVTKQGLGYVPKEELLVVLLHEQKEMEEEIAAQKEREKSNVSYLVQADEFIGEYPELDTIKYLTYSMDYLTDVSGLYGLVDFQNNKIYKNHLYPVYECYEEAEEVIEMSEEQKSAIIQALEDSAVQKWEYVTQGDDGIKWNFGMEFEDGTVISYRGAYTVPLFDGIILTAINGYKKK